MIDSNSGHIKNQHYVPQFLLRNFKSSENKNRIWCYELERNQVRLRSIAKVASENHFYDKVEGEKKDSLEYPLSKLEDKAAPIIQKILEKRQLKYLTEEERNWIALFAVIQDIRTYGGIEQTLYLQDQFIEFMQPFVPKIQEQLGDSKQIWREQIIDSTEYVKVLMKKNWVILESENAFYCSDNPFVKQNLISKSHRGNLGYDSQGIQMYLPLSPAIVLWMCCEREYPRLREVSNVWCEDASVENINSLQVEYAKRFVFSQRNDFWLVEDMLNNK